MHSLRIGENFINCAYKCYHHYVKIVNPTGKKGEDIAVEYLKKKGHKILERNFRKQYAEIDIISIHQNILVFSEVKTRTNSSFGSPLESITPWKIKPLIKTAQYYKLTHCNLPESMRIDAIAVEIDEVSGQSNIEHLENVSV